MGAPRLQTLERGFQVLKMLAGTERGLSVAEIATRLDVHRAIVYRIINTLENSCMVQRLPGGNAVLGSGLVALGAQAEGNLRLLIRPEVDALAAKVSSTAFVSIADGDECVAILAAEPRDRTVLNINYRVGTRHPLDRGASGIAILASRPESADDNEFVREARRLGYSLTRGQLQSGAIGVACPIALPREQYPLECSLGVVGLDGIDTEPVIQAVQGAARNIADVLKR